MTKKQKITEMVKDVEDWDIESLIDFAQCNLYYKFNKMGAKEVEQHYRMWKDNSIIVK